MNDPILKDVAINKRFLKDSQSFQLTIEFEDDNGFILRRVIDLEKGQEIEEVVRRVEDLADRIEGIYSDIPLGEIS